MKDSEIDFKTFYDDALAFLNFGIKTKMNPEEILSTLIHDISGIVRNYECFSPRVSGWAKAKKAVANEIK